MTANGPADSPDVKRALATLRGSSYLMAQGRAFSSPPPGYYMQLAKEAHQPRPEFEQVEKEINE